MCTSRMILTALITAVMMVVTLAAPAGPALAQGPEPYTGVDFVFLIDQSGSMCGAACNSSIQTQNDPQGFRFEGPKFAIIDFLGDQMSEIYTSSTARISIVEFGQDVDLEQYRAGEDIEYENVAIHDVLPPTAIGSDPDAWAAQRDQLLQRMTDYQVEREVQNLGNTDHLGAARKAIEVLNEMQASDPSKRLKVIVLLTDGQSAVCYPKGPQDDPYAEESCFGPGDILPQVESELDASLNGEDYYFYVVGMADASSNYWTNNGPFWESLAARHNGEARLVQSQNEVAQFMGEVVNSALSKLPLPPEGPGVISEWLPQLGDFPVRPYLQSLTFYIVRATPTDTVTIFDPQGTPLDLLNRVDGECQNGTCYYGVGRLIDKVVIDRPQPGMWRAEATIPETENVYDTVRIGTRSLFFAPQMVQPTGGTYPEGVPLDIQIAMLDLNGEPVPRYDDNLYALYPRASVVTGDGQPVAETALDPGTFGGQIVVSNPGDAFQVRLVGTSHTPDGEEFEVLDHSLEGNFTIERLTGEFVPPEGVLQQKEATLNYQVNVDNFQTLADGYRYTGQFELNHPNFATPVIIQAQDNGDGLFSALYKPESNGTYELDFKLFVVNDTTGEQVLVPLNVKGDSAQSFNVGLTTGLELVLTEPVNGSQQVKRNWLLQIVPLEIEAALIETQSGEPVDWGEVVASGGAPIINVDVRDPEGQSRSVELQPVQGEPGKFRFAGDGYAESGEWSITLPGEVGLKDGFALADTSPSVTVARVENYAAFVAWGIVLLGIVGIVVWRVSRASARRRGPRLVGHLEILDENDIPLAGGIKSLPSNVNRTTFTDLPSSIGVKKMQVKYLSDDAVEVTVDGVPTTIMHETEWDSGRDFKIKYVNPTLE